MTTDTEAQALIARYITENPRRPGAAEVLLAGYGIPIDNRIAENDRLVLG